MDAYTPHKGRKYFKKVEILVIIMSSTSGSLELLYSSKK